MKIITVHHPHSFKKEDFPPMVLALGYFDGIHKGHQRVIKTAVQSAGDQHLHSAVMTFDPHPSVVLGHKHKHIHFITPLEDKKEIISNLGVDYLFVVRFTSEFASLLPQEFVDQYIINLNVRQVVAGFDYSYGRMGKGTMETLPFHSRERFTSITVPKLTEEEDKISSTLIRNHLKEGNVSKVTTLLDRPYRMKGTVIHGDKRGRKIGFPTANIELTHPYLLPKNGVYAVRMKIHNQWYDGVCNIGFKPTFKNPDDYSLSIEVHLFEFNSSIYGEEVYIEWFERIRDEQKFSGIDELISQIQRDKDTAITYFSGI
ncbi:bifunctional riboflavin kinase/FMN adenylyltransferase [[Bacillus] enclensis]|uniref:Riboflavin biosynthesis protein n=2 Tax=Rossellomorea TaxID=2837508 RepID=A0A0V8HJ37_9BACI|nr:bifunctional riboflavin kinase/FAD synthetase [[Bacillus] enclensis]KSU62558.1 bifunctional riboflavin kinase/FMN adenylyltransferase [[Bacillus] enclensis]MBH9965436.1 bifunctional riboflavin kinase/FAD synthetase [[Bacillus] enclensis]OAT82797.1 riboflavin biosynthesis protein RibF [Bacillus sp. MKU004]SCC06312.1 riboflavin kinase / FMN adenylyltransferase [[Bacillus] enclensis]